MPGIGFTEDKAGVELLGFNDDCDAAVVGDIEYALALLLFESSDGGLSFEKITM